MNCYSDCDLKFMSLGGYHMLPNLSTVTWSCIDHVAPKLHTLFIACHRTMHGTVTTVVPAELLSGFTVKTYSSGTWSVTALELPLLV